MTKARARGTDPETSHQVARDVERKGKAATQRQACLEAVREHPGRTAYEIAALLDLEGIVPGKRLPELREINLVKNGPVRACSIRKSKAMTWWLTDLADVVQTDLFA